jgi:hypothetical protein
MTTCIAAHRFLRAPELNFSRSLGRFLREPVDHFFEALAAKPNMVSITRAESSELSAAIGMLGRFPPPNSGTSEDKDAPRSLTKISDAPALSEKSNGKSRRCLLILPSRFLARNPHTTGQTPQNPTQVQAIMRHAKMDMTLYYSHSRRKAKRAAQEKVLQHLIPEEMRVPVREPETIQ